jgi:hypothetical protein
MAAKKIGIAYVPVLLSFKYQIDTEDDAQVTIKEIVYRLIEEWEGNEFEYESMVAELNSLDWLRGSYMDQVQEVEEDDIDGYEEDAEGSGGSGGGEV